MTLQVIYELWKPFGGAYTVDTARCLKRDSWDLSFGAFLGFRVSGLEFRVQGTFGIAFRVSFRIFFPAPRRRAVQALEKMVQGLEEARPSEPSRVLGFRV